MGNVKRNRRGFWGGRLALVAGLGLIATQAFGGVVDSPLPVLAIGAKTLHVFTVPGVIKNNNLETIFMCTSLEKSGVVTVGVEVFAAAGGPPLNDVTAVDPDPQLNKDGVETMGLGETATISTGVTTAFHEDEVINTLGPASVKNGSARIISTSKKIACSVFVVDDINDPPGSMSALSVLSKKKQKGD